MLDTHSSVLTTACVLAVLLPLLRVLLNRTVFGVGFRVSMAALPRNTRLTNPYTHCVQPLGKRAIYGSSAVKMPAKQFPLLYKWNGA